MAIQHLLRVVSATLLLLLPLGLMGSAVKPNKPSIKPTICLTAKPPPCKPLYS